MRWRGDVKVVLISGVRICKLEGRLRARLVNFAQLIIQYGRLVDHDHRYPPAGAIGVEKIAIYGEHDLDRTCTSYIAKTEPNHQNEN
jgi:hypothetical protein